MTVAVIGVGSPLGADRVGWDTVEALAAAGLAEAFPRGRVTLSCLDRPGSLLVEALAAAAGAILIDAAVARAPAGAVMRLSPDDLAAGGTGFSSHGVGVAQALALAAALGTLPTRLALFGIVIAGDAQAARNAGAARAIAARALPRLYPQVREVIAGWMAAPAPAMQSTSPDRS